MIDQESRLDAIVGVVLLVGAAASVVAMAVGTGLLLAGYPIEISGDRSPQNVFGSALSLHPANIMEMGILILMATPVAGVVVLGIGFLWTRRFRFALISLLVLTLLFISFIFAAGAWRFSVL